MSFSPSARRWEMNSVRCRFPIPDLLTNSRPGISFNSLVPTSVVREPSSCGSSSTGWCERRRRLRPAMAPRPSLAVVVRIVEGIDRRDFGAEPVVALGGGGEQTAAPPPRHRLGDTHWRDERGEHSEIRRRARRVPSPRRARGAESARYRFAGIRVRVGKGR